LARSDKNNVTGVSREAGRQQVVEVIRAAGQIARIDIAQTTGVSPATVTALCQQLIQAGLVEEVAPVDPPSGQRGRPRVALRLRGTAHLIAGMKVSARIVSAVLIDFEGTTLTEYVAPMPQSRYSPGALVELVQKTLVAATAQIGKSVEDLSGLGLGLAGTVDAIAGYVHWSPSLALRNVRLRDMLEAVLPFPVFLDNDANLVAKAEQLFGEGRGISDFLVVTIEHGVGLGIVIDGRVYRGTRGCGAEFGHTKVHLDGALCRCGQRGCLEAYVADYALLREAGILMPDNEGGSAQERLDRLFEATRADDPIARSILDRASRMFGMGLSNLVNIFDPELIIISGEQMSHNFLYADGVIEAMRDEVVQIDVPPPEVRIHKWGDLMWAKGAAAYALEGVTERAVRLEGSDA